MTDNIEQWVQDLWAENQDAELTDQMTFVGVVEPAVRELLDRKTEALRRVLERRDNLHQHDIETLNGIEAACGPLGYHPPGGGDPDEDLATWLAKRLAPRTGACSRCGCTDDHACEGGCSWVDEDQTLCSECA